MELQVDFNSGPKLKQFPDPVCQIRFGIKFRQYQFHFKSGSNKLKYRENILQSNSGASEQSRLIRCQRSVRANRFVVNNAWHSLIHLDHDKAWSICQRLPLFRMVRNLARLDLQK